jgi:hypothetical protein
MQTNFAPLDLADTPQSHLPIADASLLNTELAEIPPFVGIKNAQASPATQSFHSINENASSILVDISSSDTGSELLDVEKSNALNDDGPVTGAANSQNTPPVPPLALSNLPNTSAEFRTAFPDQSGDKQDEDPFASPKLGNDSDFDKEDAFHLTPLAPALQFARDSVEYPFSDTEATLLTSNSLAASKIPGTFTDSEMDYSSVLRRVSSPGLIGSSLIRTETLTGSDWDWQWGDLPSKTPLAGDKALTKSVDTGLDDRPIINIDIPVSFEQLEASLCGTDRLNPKVIITCINM